MTARTGSPGGFRSRRGTSPFSGAAPRHASRALASGRLALSVGSGAVALVLAVVAARRFADIPWPDLHVNPGLLAVAAGLSLLGYAFKAYGWERLFAADERPQPLALAAAMGGASVTALALPGRFDDVVRIAIVRRFRACPAGVRALASRCSRLGLSTPPLWPCSDRRCAPRSLARIAPRSPRTRRRRSRCCSPHRRPCPG